MTAPWNEATAAVRVAAGAAGYDLVQPFCVGWYNDAVAPEYSLPCFGGPDSLGLLIGNSRSLWPHFVAALRRQPDLLVREHPLDHHSEAILKPIIAAVGIRYELRWVHDKPPEKKRVAMQRLAHVAGLARLSPSHLNVHPQHGPWIGLRAVAVFDCEGPSQAPPPDSPCDQCEQPCMPPYKRAVAAAGELVKAKVEAVWPRWLEVRDACPVGQASRYDEFQIRYHYTKDRRVLRELLETTRTP